MDERDGFVEGGECFLPSDVADRGGVAHPFWSALGFIQNGE